MLFRNNPSNACSRSSSLVRKRSKAGTKIWNFSVRAAVILANIFIYLRYPARILLFYKYLRHWPNVCYPQTKNEKFLWRKIFDRNPIYRFVTDKLTVRQFVKTRCSDLLMSEIIWIGASSEEIPDALLHSGIVIKTNNGTSRNIFITDEPVDRTCINKRVAKWLARPHGIIHGEWVYSKIQPLVFIERTVTTPGAPQFVDLCCHVLMGRCVLVTVDKDVKQASERIAVYDATANRLPFNFQDNAKAEKCKELPADFPVPDTFKKAVQCAENIAQEFDYIRVDFMSTRDRLYFCECTVFPMGGFSIISGGGDDLISATWDLRNSWFMQQPQRGIRRLYSRLYRYCLSQFDTPLRTKL
jgi:TupA-like ATPgrasp